MARKKQRLTAAEMSILQLLWEDGEITLSQAHQGMIKRGAKVSYTTVQTRLNRLVEKRLVARSRTRPACYSAAVGRDDVSGPMLDLLLEKVSGAVPLVAHLLQDPEISSADLQEMKRLIAEAEARQKEQE